MLICEMRIFAQFESRFILTTVKARFQWIFDFYCEFDWGESIVISTVLVKYYITWSSYETDALAHTGLTTERYCVSYCSQIGLRSHYWNCPVSSVANCNN